MQDFLKPLIDNGILNEEARQAITETWEAKLNEAREQIRVEIREEFANRYEHDKQLMVESLDRMVTESLSAEIEEFKQDKDALAEQRVQFAQKMQETAAKFNQFLTKTLAEEISEFRRDRRSQQSGLKKLESFVFQSLAEEISEFAIDKRKLTETKVRLVSEARTQLNSLKAKFVKRSSAAIEEAVTKQLTRELTQLHEDVQVAKRNAFGRKIFEAFASEFAATQLNENSEVRRLQHTVAEKDQQLAEAVQKLESNQALLEDQSRKVRVVNAMRQRDQLLSELLENLAPEKKKTMKQLLEDVQTSKLRDAFDKYLPAVLDNKPVKTRVITETKTEATGNKTANERKTEDANNIIEIKRLAGL